jgi:hypothetical protein
MGIIRRLPFRDVGWRYRRIGLLAKPLVKGAFADVDSRAEWRLFLWAYVALLGESPWRPTHQAGSKPERSQRTKRKTLPQSWQKTAPNFCVVMKIRSSSNFM